MNPEQETRLPTSPADNKRSVGPVTQSASTGAAIALLTGFLITHFTGIEIPSEVGGALAVVVGFVGSLIGGWMVKPGNGNRRK